MEHLKNLGTGAIVLLFVALLIGSVMIFVTILYNIDDRYLIAIFSGIIFSIVSWLLGYGIRNS